MICSPHWCYQWNFSLLALLIFAWGIFAGFVGIVKMAYVLTHRKDAQTAFLPRSVTIIQSFGRMVSIPIIGIIYFFHGWRLDDPIRSAVAILMIVLLFETLPGVMSDFYRLQVRKGRISPFPE